MASAQQILILSSRTGGGHASAAAALQTCFTDQSAGNILVKITQVLEEAGTVPRRLGEVYNYLLRHHQDWMQYYYWVVNRFRLNESKMILKGAYHYGKELVGRFTPDVVVSVHPMTHHFFSYLLKRLGLIEKIPIVTVVTDPCGGFWRGWACDEVQQYYVATQAARHQLVAYNVPDEKISVVGMPVHPRFQPISQDYRPELRAQLGLLPERFTVFVNAGWVGGGNIPRLLDAMVGKNLPIQVVYLCGHNQEFIAEGHRFAHRASFPVHVLGFRRDVEDWMNASDVMISKLGGLTTFEAMACHLPIIGDCTTRPMPQEAETAEFLETSGAGIMVYKPNHISELISLLAASPDQCAAMRQCAASHTTFGASDIAQNILQLINTTPSNAPAA